MSKAGSKIIEGLNEAVAYAKIDKLWRKTKLPRSAPGDAYTPYEWGYRDGVMAARSLFGTEHKGQGQEIACSPPTNSLARPAPG